MVLLRSVTSSRTAVAYCKSLSVTVDRIMTDNGNCYRSMAFARACKRFPIRHIRTKPYTPQTNGKAERFIQTPCENGPTLPPSSVQTSGAL